MREWVRVRPRRVTTDGSGTIEGRRQAENKGETTSALSVGTNALLRHGAAPALRVDDILEAIGVTPAPPAWPEPVGDAAVVLAALRDGPATADQLVGATGLPVGRVASALTELELDGLVILGDGAYRATIAA